MNDSQATQTGWWSGLGALILAFPSTIEWWIMKILCELLSFSILSIFNVSCIHRVLSFFIMTEQKVTMNLIPQHHDGEAWLLSPDFQIAFSVETEYSIVSY